MHEAWHSRLQEIPRLRGKRSYGSDQQKEDQLGFISSLLGLTGRYVILSLKKSKCKVILSSQHQKPQNLPKTLM